MDSGCASTGHAASGGAIAWGYSRSAASAPALGLGDGRVPDRAVLVVEQHRGERFAHVLFDMVGEHADQEVAGCAS